MSISITKASGNYLYCNPAQFGTMQRLSAMTLALWFKPATTGATAQHVSYLSSTANGDVFGFKFTDTGTTPYFNATAKTAIEAPTAATWHYYAQSQASNNASSGKYGLVASGSGSFAYDRENEGGSGSTATIAYLSLGGTTWNQTNDYGGEVCCLRVWNAQLTATELTAEMNSATPVRTANLIADWRLSTVSDLTSTVNSYALTKLGTGVTTGATEPTDISAAAQSIVPHISNYVF